MNRILALRTGLVSTVILTVGSLALAAGAEHAGDPRCQSATAPAAVPSSLLSIIVELVTGSFGDAVKTRVLDKADMSDGGLLRRDDLPPDSAIGYLRNGRSNLFHLPVVAAGDGGVYVSLDDMSALWTSLPAGDIVSTATMEMMMTAESVCDERRSYGRGFWIGNGGDRVWLEGMDAGVSFQSGIYRSSGNRYTVMANNSSDAWPLVKAITQPESRL